MSGRIVVLGAAGRLGYAAAQAFRDAGWSVVSFVRPGAGPRAPRGTAVVQSQERAAVADAARGADIILHAFNTPFTQWQRLALQHTYAVIDAAEATGATIMFPGNLYNYGARMPALIDETTPMQPTTRKGQLRVAIEQRLREASERGVRVIILRAGDFYGAGRGSWFDLVIAKQLAQGRITYPGPLDVAHEWAYVPDVAAALVRLAASRAMFPAFETFGFPGHAVTGRELAAAVAKATGRGYRVGRMSWWLARTVGQLLPLGRELAEIAYLWRVPHRISGDKLEAAIGEVPHTPFETAIAAALRGLG